MASPMRSFGKSLGRFLLAALVLVAALYLLGPREELNLRPDFDASRLPEDLDSYLDAREGVFDDLTPGTQKRIVWAGRSGQKTGTAILYLHGFSATSEEVRPLPDLVAAELGANLYFTRLAGHGRSGEALADARASDWMFDLAEALAIGERIGDRVIVISTSTGGSLAAEAVLQPDLAEKMDGVVFISPNFGLDAFAAPALTWPFARQWVPLLIGEERCFAPENEAHEQYWTNCYPTGALFQMAALAEHAGAAHYGGAEVPALFLYAPADQVVSPEATEKVAARWGAEAVAVPVTIGAGDDPHSHVIAGDILSPGMTDPLAARIVTWVNALVP